MRRDGGMTTPVSSKNSIMIRIAIKKDRLVRTAEGLPAESSGDHDSIYCRGGTQL